MACYYPYHRDSNLVRSPILTFHDSVWTPTNLYHFCKLKPGWISFTENGHADGLIFLWADMIPSLYTILHVYHHLNPLTSSPFRNISFRPSYQSATDCEPIQLTDYRLLRARCFWCIWIWIFNLPYPIHNPSHLQAATQFTRNPFTASYKNPNSPPEVPSIRHIRPPNFGDLKGRGVWVRFGLRVDNLFYFLLLSFLVTSI